MVQMMEQYKTNEDLKMYEDIIQELARLKYEDISIEALNDLKNIKTSIFYKYINNENKRLSKLYGIIIYTRCFQTFWEYLKSGGYTCPACKLKSELKQQEDRRKQYQAKIGNRTIRKNNKEKFKEYRRKYKEKTKGHNKINKIIPLDSISNLIGVQSGDE